MSKENVEVVGDKPEMNDTREMSMSLGKAECVD